MYTGSLGQNVDSMIQCHEIVEAETHVRLEYTRRTLADDVRLGAVPKDQVRLARRQVEDGLGKLAVGPREPAPCMVSGDSSRVCKAH